MSEGRKIKIVGPDGNVLPPGEIGDLYCRARHQERVFEYHGDPEKTLRAHPEAGVFTIGDIGRVDADGYVYEPRSEDD